MTLRAACLCGATQYEWDGRPDEIILCHCSQCRRANGGAFNVAVLAKARDICFTAKAALSEYESSPGKYRAFCSSCGAGVYSRRADLPDVYRLRGGLIVDLPAPKNLEQIFVEDRWDWLVLPG